MPAFWALVAGSLSLGALAANEISPAALNAVRFWLAAAVIGVLAWATGQCSACAFRGSWRYLVMGGLFGVCFALTFEVLKTTPSVRAAASFKLMPVMAAGFGWLLVRQVMTAPTEAVLSLPSAKVMAHTDLGPSRVICWAMALRPR